MKIGIPKGLLYYKYYPFIDKFFCELGAEVVLSEDTNKKILDLGVKYCVDDACLPIKVFHGHVFSIKDKCDLMFIPRFMEVERGQYICPKFCGLPEMILDSIPDMPDIISAPIMGLSEKKLWNFAEKAGCSFTKNRNRIAKAFSAALTTQQNYTGGIMNDGYKTKIALVGHPYNVYDKFINMNIVRKLNSVGIGLITEEYIDKKYIEREISQLFKKPFWNFARNSYGFASYVGRNKMVDGIIYISSFACGIDSVVIELIKDKLKNFPILVLKIDEQTGEAGVDTRIEAFADMLERRCS